MDIQSTRLELIKLLLEEKRESVLEKVSQLLSKEEASEFDQAFERSLEDKAAGRTVAHKEVQQKYAKWL